LPGALVKVPDSDKLARVADPFRQPEELLTTISTKVGSMSDKMSLLPLILKEKTTGVEQLFREEETDTLDLLTRKWFISDVLLEGARNLHSRQTAIWLTSVSYVFTHMVAALFFVFRRLLC
jgi:hypothetical protein